MKYVLLLRGINVGGKNKVSMAELKEMISHLGYTNVISYINSGNIIFDTSDNIDTVDKNISTILNTYPFNINKVIASIKNDEKLFNNIEITYSKNQLGIEKEKVYLSAGVIDTIFDSLKFLKTSDKLKIKKNKGLFFKGSTYIEKENISKLKKIVSSWKGLFSEATQNFVLIGFFNKKIDDYERWNCNKEEVIESLEKLVILCEKAEKENKIIRCRKLTVKLTNNREER